MPPVAVVVMTAWLVPVTAAACPDLRLEIRYQAARQGGAPADYVDEMRAVVARVDAMLSLPRPLAVEYRSCRTANAFYYPTQHALVICHELWDARRRRYEAAGIASDVLDKRLRDAMTFTFFHEFAHALHAELDLPILGSSEDAADEIATRWMIRLGLADLAAQAARGHHLRAQEQHEFWDEHGSGAQRGFAIACVLYGADRKHFAGLMTELGVPVDRRAKCERDHPRRERAWTTLLGVRQRSTNNTCALSRSQVLPT